MKPGSTVLRRAVLTGGPGTGKSTLLAALALNSVATEPEIARQVLEAPGGMALRAEQPVSFGRAMLAGEIASFQRAARLGGLVVFDRGLPDTVGFFHLGKLPVPQQLEHACRTLRYEGPIFRAPPWPEIYRSDEQRIQTWAEAVASDAAVIAAWREYGYEPIDLPFASVAERVAFVLNRSFVLNR